jgi:hypothetical protein
MNIRHGALAAALDPQDRERIHHRLVHAIPVAKRGPLSGHLHIALQGRVRCRRLTDLQPFVAESLPPLGARKDGYSLHAGTAVHKNDRQGLEQLARYRRRPLWQIRAGVRGERGRTAAMRGCLTDAVRTRLSEWTVSSLSDTVEPCLLQRRTTSTGISNVLRSQKRYCAKNVK